MNINNKINKIDKLIINNKEILSIKYNERNQLLEDNSINKDLKYDKLDKLDEYIENIEFENKKLEKELEELKKIYNFNIKREKTQLCSFFKLPKGCNKGIKCSFAHSEDELKNDNSVKPCISGLECYDKDCKYYHPENWNYKNNIKICNFFKKGYCINEGNCKFKHIKEKHEMTDDNIGKKLDEDIEINENKYNYVKDIVKSFMNENIIYEIIENNKIHQNFINVPNNIYKFGLKNDENIGNNNLLQTINIIVDVIEYKDLENNEAKHITFSDFENVSDTIKLVNNLQNKINEYIKDIKKSIDESFIDEKEKYGICLKLQLNKIMSELILFKNNFKDITDINIIDKSF